MRRTNTYTAHATETWQKSCLCEWLAASCAFWNEVNYRRRQATIDGDSWTSVTYTDLYDDYAAVISKAACQQLVQKNSEAWRSYDELDADPDRNPSLPGYWGNKNDGYDMKSVVRNDLYTITWSADQSTIEIPVGKHLNDKYDIPGRGYRVELELNGEPRWKGKSCRLDIMFDESSQCFRVNQPVDVQPDYLERVRQADFSTTTTLPTEEHTDTTTEPQKNAAIDVGANNTLTVITEDGDCCVFHARPQFREFQQGHREIADLQSALPDETYSSRRIRNLYDSVYDSRDHHRDAAVKHAAKWLLEYGVTRVYVGDVADVLSTHWSAEVNAKTHAFWSHGQLTDRLEDTFEVAGLELEEVSETGTSSTCPYCGGDGENVTRCGDEFRCHECGVDAHSDMVGAALILDENCTGVDVSRWFAPTGRQPEGEDGGRSMARPVPRDSGRARDGGTDGEFSVTYLEWDDHEWIPAVSEAVGTLGSFDQQGVNEPAKSSGRPSGWVASRGIPRLKSGEDVKPPLLVAIQNHLGTEQMGLATSSQQFFRNLGGTIGVAVLGVVLNASIREQLASVPGVSDLSDLQRLLLGGGTTPAGIAAIMVDGLTIVFSVAVVVCLTAAAVAAYIPSVKQMDTVSSVDD